jgi:hypothetical protein
MPETQHSRKSRLTRRALQTAGYLTLAAAGSALWAICTSPRTGPDVVVFELMTPGNYVTGAPIDGMRAYALGTKSLNQGDKDLKWFSSTNEHPVIGQNLYRLKTDASRPGGRFEQIGQSWLKHGFTALAGTDAGCSCTFEAGHSSGAWLGQGCTDPYSAGLNADRSRLGPRYQVNAATGLYTYPFDNSGVVDDNLDRRLEVADSDMDPALNPGARYFGEGHYVTPDDAAVGNAFNNASFREVVITDSTSRSIGYAGSGPFATTQIGLPALAAWPLIDSSVVLKVADIYADGRLDLAAKVHDNGDGTWRYEYAIHNLNSHRSVQRVEIGVPAASAITNAGFHDVDYHSGEPYTNTDWTIDSDAPNGLIAWFGETQAANANANALRWGTTYNFWFDADQAPGTGSVALTLFRAPAAGEPAGFTVELPVPGGTGLFRDDFERGTYSAWDDLAP